MPRNLTAFFVNLHSGQFLITSEESLDYNCFAWAANDTQNIWGPVARYYWPPNVPRAETLDAYVAVFGTLGFEPCAHGQLEVGAEKIAIFVNAQMIPTHAARQLENGRWTSKIGDWEDIEHVLADLSGTPGYGTIAQYLRRPR